MSKLLAISWSEDNYDCEDCGWQSSTGAVATLDGVQVFNTPAAACCTSPSLYVEISDVVSAVLQHLGYSITETEDATLEPPEKGLLVAWSFLDGTNSKGETTWSHGARAWLDGVLVYDRPADLEKPTYTNLNDVMTGVLAAMDIEVAEVYLPIESRGGYYDDEGELEDFYLDDDYLYCFEDAAAQDWGPDEASGDDCL